MTSSSRGSAAAGELRIQSMVAGGRLESVVPDPVLAVRILDAARADVGAAEAIREAYPSTAFDVAYDAARKAATALMEARGLRVRQGAGGHRTVGEVVGALLEPPLGRRFQALRRLRNATEYPTAEGRPAESSDASAAIAFAHELLALIAPLLERR